MGLKRCSFLLGVFIFCLALNSFAADKLASVDINRIATEYKKAQDYNKKIEDKKNLYEKEIKKKNDETKQFQDKLALLSDKEKEGRRPELEKKIGELRDFVREKETDLRKEDFESSKEIAEDIKNAINRYASKEGYSVVFDDRALVYETKAMDISDKIIEDLNKNYKQ